MENHTSYNEGGDAVRTNIWYELQRHHIKMPIPRAPFTWYRPLSQPQRRVSTRSVLHYEPLAVPAARGSATSERWWPTREFHQFGRGEKLLEQGAEGTRCLCSCAARWNVSVMQTMHLHNATHLGAASTRSALLFRPKMYLPQRREKRSATIACLRPIVKSRNSTRHAGGGFPATTPSAAGNQ